MNHHGRATGCGPADTANCARIPGPAATSSRFSRTRPPLPACWLVPAKAWEGVILAR
jgi:hypothetical protein